MVTPNLIMPNKINFYLAPFLRYKTFPVLRSLFIRNSLIISFTLILAICGEIILNIFSANAVHRRKSKDTEIIYIFCLPSDKYKYVEKSRAATPIIIDILKM